MKLLISQKGWYAEELIPANAEVIMLPQNIDTFDMFDNLREKDVDEEFIIYEVYKLHKEMIEFINADSKTTALFAEKGMTPLDIASEFQRLNNNLFVLKNMILRNDG